MPPTLDLDNHHDRSHRIKALLEKTDASTPSAATRTAALTYQPSFPSSPPHAVPTSELMSRAEAFLPRLAASNLDLAHRASLDPTSVDIEHLSSPEDEPHIEMNLALGVFEQSRRPAGNRDESDTSTSSSSSSPSSSDESTSDSEGSTDESENAEDSDSPKKPSIVVLSETRTDDDDDDEG